MSGDVNMRMKRWHEQRWLLDTVIRTVGVEWDQPRIAYMAAPAGPEAGVDFRLVAERIRKAADIDREFAKAAERREKRAEAYEKEGRPVAARESWLIASLLWASARWPIFEVTDKLLHYEERMNACYLAFARNAPHPVERVDIPFAGKAMPAYLHLPRKPAAGERFPCVVNIPGMDSSKENGVAQYGDPLLERGIAVLSVDGPGQGECCSIPIHVTATNHADAWVATVDWLCGRAEIDPARIAFKGTSFGSFFGTQAAAALGDRIKGCAVSAVCQEPGANTIFNMASPSFKLRFMFMANYQDEAEFDRFAATLDLRPIAKDIRCPYLVVAGEDDQLSPIEHTYALFDLLKCPKSIVVYEGANHSISEGMAARLGESRNTLIADWLKDRLDGKPMRAERVIVDSTGRSNVTPVDR
jgi:fermentation-respiration switch protein FrsA (DUF1100 family)